MSDQWYFRLLNEEFGPVSPSAIREMLADGRLAPDDTVRREESTAWVPARSVDFAEGQPDEPEELHDLAELDFQLVSSSTAAETPPAATPPAAEPAELNDLSELNFKFVESRPSVPSPVAESPREDPAPAAGHPDEDELGVLASDEDIPLDDLPLLDEGNSRSRPVAPSSPPPQRPAAATTPDQPIAAATHTSASRPEPPRPVSTTAGRRGESLLAACLTESPDAGSRPKHRTGRGWMASLAQVNPLLLAVLVVGVLIQGWRFLAAGERDAAADYHTLSAHYQELLQLRQQVAPLAKWQDFAQRVRADLEPMVADLEGMTTAKRPVQQKILFAARDGLLQMVADSPQKPGVAEARDFIPAMREAHALLGQADLPHPPEMIASMAPKGSLPQRKLPPTDSATPGETAL